MNKPLSLLLFILIFFCGTTVKADPPSIKKVDSLKSILSRTKNTNTRIDILNQLSRAEKKKLFDWIQQVPPQSRSDDFAHQNELWKNTLNQLQQ